MVSVVPDYLPLHNFSGLLSVEPRSAHYSDSNHYLTTTAANSKHSMYGADPSLVNIATVQVKHSYMYGTNSLNIATVQVPPQLVSAHVRLLLSTRMQPIISASLLSCLERVSLV